MYSFRSILRNTFPPLLLAAGVLLPGYGLTAETKAATVQPAKPAQHDSEAVYAIVNGQAITIRDYVSAFNASMRKKFYHFRPPEGEMAKVREEVLDEMVMRILLLEAAKKSRLVAEQGKIAEAIAGYDKQYAESASWKENRARLVPGLQAQLAEQDILAQIEKSARTVPDPTDAEVLKFYQNNPALFTEPDKMRLSTILLTIDPSSPASEWERTMEEAKKIYERLKNGADFAETARLHSNGKEAPQGGDMGYLHRGMMQDALELKVDSFKLGEITEPITLLDGIAIFRLDDRIPPRKREFADVAERARSLARREREEAAWNSLQKRLKSSAKVKVLISPTQSLDGKMR